MDKVSIPFSPGLFFILVMEAWCLEAGWVAEFFIYIYIFFFFNFYLLIGCAAHGFSLVLASGATL